ncbi:MAG TPA: formylmethanofuran dehydrogenase [Methanosarcinales archaeon]|nr:formylmethanofuran dehydrogenase [Methanosarcinales archaeon]
MKMGFDEFLASPECEVVIVAYPDIFRTEAKLLHGTFSREYQELSAIIMLDSEDMIAIGVKDADLVKVESVRGSVVVAAKKSDSEEGHPGTGYMPEGAWSNVLGACPVPAKISRAHQERGVPAIEELLKPKNRPM